MNNQKINFIQASSNSFFVCHVCNAQQLDLHPNYTSLPRVASDCSPWPAGGKLATCPECFCVQNPTDSRWYEETEEIYDHYQIYRQSTGNEQGVFFDGEKLIPRSAKIFQQALSYLDLKNTGRLLDIGCANGELLRYFSSIAPQWKLSGFEINEHHRQEVESISNVEQFAFDSLENLKNQFDIITLIHVLEHLPNPISWLKNLHKYLMPNGLILIQVPDPMQNPYNLLVADHCSHFLMSDLLYIARKAGYEVITCSDRWVSREFSLLLKPNLLSNLPVEKKLETKILTYPENGIQWLHNIMSLGQSLISNKKKGVWGSAIAATWLYSVMGEEIDFFVDEDSNRVGQQHLGKPILAPTIIPKNSHVFVALTPEIANNIVSRWANLDVNFYVPPVLIY